ncbi:hypothetical protein ACFUCV_03805 [Specibacter sp. NPDC057265]|uniref:hypothetical protein n=1 Tax=Specibacter sp. NPDC057265 TaxID=3346075 RepID=UPI00363182EE
MAKTPAQRAAKHGEAATPPIAAAGSPQRTPQKAQSNANLLLIAGSVAALFLFWYFHLLTLNQMSGISGGLAMPDSMVLGFDVAHVETLRAAMDDDALGQLQFVHKTAGMLFPLVFALISMTVIAMNVAKRAIRRMLWIIPIVFAAIQLWANVAIDNMLGADVLDAGSVTLASTLVVLSWLFLVLSLVAMGVSLFLGRRRRHTSPADAGRGPAA